MYGKKPILLEKNREEKNFKKSIRSKSLKNADFKGKFDSMSWEKDLFYTLFFEKFTLVYILLYLFTCSSFIV